jgi:hypothetical protein
MNEARVTWEGAVHYLFTLIRVLLLVAAERPKVELEE